MTARLQILLSLIFVVPFASAQRTSEADLQCKYMYAIEQGFLAQHISGIERNKALEERVVAQYIKRLDPTKIYLLQSDIDEIKKQMSGLLEKTKTKDCAVFVKAQELVVSRVKERVADAKKFLGKDYKFDSKVEFVFDPEKRDYPKTTADANMFLKNYVHFQVSNNLATDMKLPEAKANVIKSWDRVSKRLTETKQDDIYAGYLDSFARALDPHSSFFSKDVLEDFEITMSLSLEGIGATLSSNDGFTIIDALVPGGAAARSGLLQPQDKIVAVGQGEKGEFENVVEWDLRDVVRKIRGKKGTKVRLSVLRKKGEGKDRLEVVLVRDKIKLEDEAASISYDTRSINGEKKTIGVLNFPSFYADSRKGGRSSATDLKKLISEAKTRNVDGLVLDLSSNGGGSLDDAVKIAGLFFQTGNVVKQSSRDESRGASTLRDVDPTVDWNGPLVVLTSRISASASEIVAGTLKDYQRAVVVGNDHTFGKGSVQTVMPIPNDMGALKVTIGMFFTPGGFSTQHKGVESDVFIPGAYEIDEVGEKSLDYSLPPKKIESFVSNEAYVKSGQQEWTMITGDQIKALQSKSKERVDKSEEFKKIVDERTKAQVKGKIIKLSDVTKDKEKQEKEKKQKSLSKTEKEKEYLKRADIQEATDVLLDLISIQKKKSTVSKN